MKTNCFTKWFASLLAVILLLSGVGQPVKAATNRSATIGDVRGTVWITKAGGHLSVRAYPEMTLQEGDLVATDAFASISLRIEDTQDELTIAENARLVLADLRKESGNAVTRLTVWSGLVLASANPDRKTGDIFEVNTPGQHIAAKGTNFFVQVDPANSNTSIFVASGIVNASNNEGTNNLPVPILPAQQLHMQPGIPNLDDYIEPANLNGSDAIRNSHIMEQLLKNKEKIDRENERLVEELKQNMESNVPSPDSAATADELREMEKRLKGLLSLIASKAVESGSPIPEELLRLNEIVEEWQLSTAEIEMRNRLEQLRKQQAEEMQKKREEQQNREQQLLQRLQEKRELQIEQQRKAAEEAKRRAEEAFSAQISESERNAFTEALWKQEAERQRQDEAAKRAEGQSKPTPVPTPEPDSSPVTRPEPTPTPDPEPGPKPDPEPEPEPNPEPPSQTIDEKLAAAFDSIPPDYWYFYTMDSQEALYEAMEMPEETDAEKIEKTAAILMAIQNLEKLPLVNITVEVSGTTVILSWENPEEYDDIRVFANYEPVWQTSEDIDFENTSATLTTLQANTEYELFVEFRRKGDDNPAAISNLINITIPESESLSDIIPTTTDSLLFQ